MPNDIVRIPAGSYANMLTFGLQPNQLWAVPVYPGLTNNGLYMGHPTDPEQPPLLIAGAAGGSAFEGVIHVAKNGNDETGSRGGLPFLTIQAAVDARESGDVIQVWPGDYEEDVVTEGNLTIHYMPGARHSHAEDYALTLGGVADVVLVAYSAMGGVTAGPDSLNCAGDPMFIDLFGVVLRDPCAAAGGDVTVNAVNSYLGDLPGKEGITATGYSIAPLNAGVILYGTLTIDPNIEGAIWCDTANGRVLKLSAGA